jgi:hypothetical protein
MQRYASNTPSDQGSGLLTEERKAEFDARVTQNFSIFHDKQAGE